MQKFFPWLFLGAVAAAGYVGELPQPLVVFYLLVSLLAFSLYAWDKAAARAGRRRTPERTLHLLAVAGGWPGAMLAQQWLRHKSVKRPFRAVYWLTVIINLAALFYWLRYGLPSL